MASDYKELGLNDKLQSEDSILNKDTGFLNALTLDYILDTGAIKARNLQNTIVETHFRLTDQHRFTNETSFVFHGPDNAVTGTAEPIAVLLNTNDMRNVEIYLEMNASGQDNAACIARLYNMNTSSPVPNGTLTSGTASDVNRFRSNAITLTPGTAEYAIQYKRSGGDSGDFPGIEEAHLVVRTNQ